ncbi:S1/P1 nuclease [Euzebyella saccharophila]|uniref:S1/P1 nuclease n=1 Tax=Euzebyella saccharophila TaxID=679664 RepID=A0ABV8JPX5_9FLAO|nr:S1/P1 nuclease [Euzebyella saccharophila]
MRILLIVVLFSTSFLMASDGDWSKTGHRAVGKIAQEHLSRKAKKIIKTLLNGRGLATIANFADEIKSDTAYRKFGPWHYVNMPENKRYKDVEPSPYGDVVMGIQKCIAILKDEESNLEDKQFYLKMLVHLMGDVHQPLHVGRAEDKGGNDIQLQWFGEGTNLHRVWDSHMIDDYQMSYTELASSLPKLNKKEVLALQEGDLYTWVNETQDLANEVYNSVEVGEKLYYRYSYDWWSTVEVQLQKGGIRLAKVLNDIFG